jgi:hypothetical protein
MDSHDTDFDFDLKRVLLPTPTSLLRTALLHPDANQPQADRQTAGRCAKKQQQAQSCCGSQYHAQGSRAQNRCGGIGDYNGLAR